MHAVEFINAIIDVISAAAAATTIAAAAADAAGFVELVIYYLNIRYLNAEIGEKKKFL